MATATKTKETVEVDPRYAAASTLGSAKVTLDHALAVFDTYKSRHLKVAVDAVREVREQLDTLDEAVKSLG